MRKRSSRRMTGERENSVDEKTRSSSEANLNELFAASSPIRQHSHIAAISSGRICASALTIRYDTLFLLLSVNGRFAKPFCPRGKEGQPAAQCNWLKGVGIPTGIATKENKNMKVADRRNQPPREKAQTLRLATGEGHRNAEIGR